MNNSINKHLFPKTDLNKKLSLVFNDKEPEDDLNEYFIVKKTDHTLSAAIAEEMISLIKASLASKKTEEEAK